MVESPEAERSFEHTLAYAAHHREAMMDRRNIGLRVVVGVVAFDLIVLKLAVDAAGRVSDPGQLTWAVRVIAVGAFVVLAGMLLQLEGRNRDDRPIYRDAEKRARAMYANPGPSPLPRPRQEESFWVALSRSWATTWTLAGVFVLTVAIWWMAGLLTSQQVVDEAASPSGASAVSQSP